MFEPAALTSKYVAENLFRAAEASAANTGSAPLVADLICVDGSVTVLPAR